VRNALIKLIATIKRVLQIHLERLDVQQRLVAPPRLLDLGHGQLSREVNPFS
jgi:hypothetical protein|tara:strand:+ start:910 stop:1065 length:156 start_codon:yes stop_codon:yes gene_type:complete